MNHVENLWNSYAMTNNLDGVYDAHRDKINASDENDWTPKTYGHKVGKKK